MIGFFSNTVNSKLFGKGKAKLKEINTIKSVVKLIALENQGDHKVEVIPVKIMSVARKLH